MTVVEHTGKGVIILDRYPWRLELNVGELLALAGLAEDPDACLDAAALAREDRLSALLRAAAELPADDRRRLIDQCAAVADRLSPPWAAEPAVSPRAVAGVAL